MNLSPRDVADTFVEGIDRTRARLRHGLDRAELLKEIRTELKELASPTATLDTAFGLRACALLSAAVAESIGTRANDPELDRYIEECAEDLDATVSSLISLLPEIGRAKVVASMRRLFLAASAASAQDLADGEYFGDLFLATADAMALLTEG